MNSIFNLYIAACQRGGVSNKTTRAPGSDKTQGQGSFGPLITIQNFKKKNGPCTGPVLLRQGEPGTSKYEYLRGKRAQVANWPKLLPYLVLQR